MVPVASTSTGLQRIGDRAAFEAAFGPALGVSRETADRLTIYTELLAKWQKAINLVSPASLADVWHRHMADSAQLVDLAPSGPLKWVDLGSGAGFPGLVVAILLAGRAGSSVTLVESDTRKCAFLGEVVRKTGISGVLAVEILNARIENPSTQARLEGAGVGRADVVSARALAPLERLLTLAGALFAPQTVGLFPKGRDVATEIEAAKHLWRFRHELKASRTDADARIVVVRDLEAKTR